MADIARRIPLQALETVAQNSGEPTAEDVTRVALEMGLLGGQPVVDAIEPAVQEPSPQYPIAYDVEDDDAPIPPSRLAAFREQLFRERDDIAGADARYRKLRIERGEPEFLNSDAYGPQARIMVDGVVTELAGDRKRKANEAYLGDTIENIAKGAVLPEGAHSSSGSGRVGIDPKMEKLRRHRGRPRYEEDEPLAKSATVIARVTQHQKQILRDKHVTTAMAVALLAQSLDAGASPEEIADALDDLSAKKRAS